MSTPSETPAPERGRLIAKALAEGPVPPENISAMLVSPEVEAHFRAGYALLIIRYAELFPPELVTIANQALPQALAIILHLNLVHDACAIRYQLERNKKTATPEVVILQMVAPANKERFLQAMLEGKIPK